MKRLFAVLILLSLSILVGCSGTSKVGVGSDKFKGVYGTYEWVKTIKLEGDEYVPKGSSALLHIIRYTNTTNQAVKPEEAIREEMVLQHETEIELNSVNLQGFFIHTDNENWVKENSEIMENLEIVENAYKNIKPGATVDFAMNTVAVEDERLDSIYFRNRMKTPADKVTYEKKIIISNP